MGRIGDKLETIRLHKRKAFIPFFTAFYPSRELFKEFLMRSDDAGADFIEVGVPFSDPLADGRMIQYSSHWALAKGFSFSGLLEEMEKLKGRLDSSVILMSYFNPILQRGLTNLGKEMREAGIDGVIISDLALEESIPVKKALSIREIDLIYLVAPSTREQRIRNIGRQTKGFIYVVSLMGITGMREKLPENLITYINKVRKITSKPLCVGFGISSPDQAMRVAKYSDGVIVGSALIDLMRGQEKEKNLAKIIEARLRALRKAI